MSEVLSPRRGHGRNPWVRPGLRRAGAVALLALLAAGCGGGGGGGGSTGGTGPSTPTDTGNGWLTFAPTRTEITAYAGEGQPISITATSSKVIEGTFNVGIVDRQGVTTGVVEMQSTNPMTYVAKMQLSPSLVTGTFEGNFEVRLCRDDPQVCGQPVQGSPWQVPFKISVLKATNLTPLAPLAGATGWVNAGGNASRNGVVNAQVQAENFNRRWVAAEGLSVPLADGGRILGWRGFGIGAVSEFDGSKLWERGVSGAQERDWYSGLAVGEAQLWVLAEGYDAFAGRLATQLIAYDTQTGQIRQEIGIEGLPPTAGRDFPVVAAPLMQSGAAYSATASGVVRRNGGATWNLAWQAVPTAADQLPADRNGLGISLANGRVVGFDGVRLWAVNAETGAPLLSVKATGDSSYNATAPVLTADDLAYVTVYPTQGSTAGQLIAFDLAAKSQRWARANAVSSNVVAKGAVVYAVASGNMVLALDAVTGSELWRWTPPVPVAAIPRGGSSLLLVGKYAFTSMGDVTYAIDVETHKTAWQYPMGGSLAVSSNGTLLIGTLSRLVAINLR